MAEAKVGIERRVLLAYRVPEESTAWTVYVARPPANVFVTGGGIHHSLTGRYYAEGVEHVGHGRLFVQRSHPHKELQRSVLDVEGLDVLAIFEQFFRDSEQAPARFVSHSDTEYSMVLGLPDADPDWIRGLADTEVAAMREQGDLLDRREFVFRCGCSPDQVAGTLARMFATQADEFFAGESVVEALCPRCGARHLLDRKTFDRIVEGL